MNYPSGFVKLTYSDHAKSRLKNRTTGSLIVAPSLVRITADNVVEEIIKRGKLVKVVVCLKYKRETDMYLPIVLPQGVVKTVYFKDVKARKRPSRDENCIKQEVGIEPRQFIVEIPESLKSQPYTEKESRRISEDEENVSGDLGGEESGWQKFLGVVRRIFGFGTSDNLFRPYP